ncbi:MAG: asparagine--tRNA ligase [Chloroflexi bacterium]|nr:asparagine--tRNA ligase [Chloroflexota bacterium]
MTDQVHIKNIANHVGQTVTLDGWLADKTDKGRLQFLKVRDGTGLIQATVFEKAVTPEVFAAAKAASQESSLSVTGEVRADPRAPGGYELSVSGLNIVQLAKDYPIGPKEHGIEFLMANRHLWVRHARPAAILKIRATVIKAIRDFLDSNGFINVDTPIFTPNAVEGTSTLFAVDYFGEPAYLTQSGQLYNEANAAALGKVYCFGPTFRAEKSKTRRHLTEFWMVEPEWCYAHLDDLLALEEQFIAYIVARVLETRQEELKVLERDTKKLESILPPFPRLHYDDAVTWLNAQEDASVHMIPGDDLGSPQETALSLRYDRPVFVHHYPAAVKAFYMEVDPNEPDKALSADLLASEGYGEIIGGGERTASLELLEQRIKEHNLPREPYQWYLDLRRFGSVPHVGFGLGVERTVTWITDIHHLREAIAYPRMLEKMYP